MNIAGVLVHSLPEASDQVSAALAALPGVEVHQRNADGRMIVTIEDQDESTAGDSLLAMHRLEGVLSAALVYHHFEPQTVESPPTSESEES